MRRRHKRMARAASYLVTGAIILQLGGFCTIFNTTATTTLGGSGFLIDDNGNFLGVFAVCGLENFIVIDEDGIPQGEVQDTEDDLLFGCPVRQIQQGGGG